MSPSVRKILAVVEVTAVVFAVVPGLTLGVYRLLPQFETWQTAVWGFPFPVFVYVIMIAVSLLLPWLRRQPLAAYGLTFKPLRYQLDIAATCFIPVVLANMPFAMGVDHKSWGGALLLATVQLGLLFVLVWALRRKPMAAASGLWGAGLLFFSGHMASGAIIGKAAVLFLTYALFVGFGEEVLYRGYMQSRLNAAFGKPYRFYGVAFGWGTLITALLFGLTHVGILRWLLGSAMEVTWAWGAWTVFSGLVFGFVRERSGSILPGALLHGLPQAIATVAMLFL